MKHGKEPEKVSSFSGGEQNEIARWLNEVRFRRVCFGGVDETDVWKKIEELNRMYEKMLIAERSKYQTILEAYRRSAAEAGRNKDEP